MRYKNIKTNSNTNLYSCHSSSPALLFLLVDPNPIGQTSAHIHDQYNECGTIADQADIFKFSV